MQQQIKQIREAAEADFITFAKLVSPSRLFGNIHIEVMEWMQSSTSTNKLLLLPRAHQKSFLMALWAAWYITKHPETTIIYLSATATLAENQLYAIKSILDSKVYRRYWPTMTHPDEGKRERWNVSEIMVDHPKRKAEGVRDATVKAVGLTATTTGLHADVLIYDDIVVPENAYTLDGRSKVSAALSQFASIRNAGGITMAAGTRYHPADQYSIFKNQLVAVTDTDGNVIGKRPRWEIFERVVEVDGEFLWPRQYRPDGRWFGFDKDLLAEIKSEYEDKTQFYAQYYNNPEDPEGSQLSNSDFIYYEQRNLKTDGDVWYYGSDRLSVYAAIDFAFSLSTKADFTSLVVIGVSADNSVYVLDIERFKTDEITKYFDAIYNSYLKWEFKVIRAEVSVAQQALVREIKNLISKNGLRLRVDEFRPTRSHGSKAERISSILMPKYKSKTIFHKRGGNTQILEEELTLQHPPHDDVKDALAAAIDVAVPPPKRRVVAATASSTLSITRFGGVKY